MSKKTMRHIKPMLKNSDFDCMLYVITYSINNTSEPEVKNVNKLE